jgi:tetratricopeptide (TPR) repeat protein
MRYYCNRLVVLTLLFLFALNTQSQLKQVEKADEYFSDFNYIKALELYLEIEQGGQDEYYLSCRIADCYRCLGDAEKAVGWYEKAQTFPDVEASVYFNLYQQLLKLGSYQEADQYLKKYHELKYHNEGNYRSSAEIIQELKKDSDRYVIYPLSINTKFSEIGPTIYEDKLVFSSNRGGVAPMKRFDIRDGSRFYKFYEAKRKDLLSFSETKMFDRRLSTKYNDGPVVFNNDYTVAYITRNVVSATSKNMTLNIYTNVKENGKWSKKATPLPLSRADISYMHAFITKENNRIYFVSDMPGGYGGMDIYYSNIEYGFLSSPVNLGPAVNSAQNEMFPFENEDGILYYASDKQGGMGGLDVYVALRVSDYFVSSYNVGYPINTSSDDFGMIWLADGLSGYFVSDREGGMGKDDIYAFTEKQSQPYFLFEGTVISDVDKDPIEEARVNIYQGNDLILSVNTGAEGKFAFFTKMTNNLRIEVKKTSFLDFSSELDSLAQIDDKGFQLQVKLQVEDDDF